MGSFACTGCDSWCFFCFYSQHSLQLSVVAISLSAMIASLMVWYNIETTKRAVIESNVKAACDEFLRFYVNSFQILQKVEQLSNMPYTNFPEEYAHLVVAMLEQYLAEYPRYSRFQSLLNKAELRVLAEQLFSIFHDIHKIKKWKNPRKFQRMMINAGYKPYEAQRIWMRMNKWQSVNRKEARFVMNIAQISIQNF